MTSENKIQNFIQQSFSDISSIIKNYDYHESISKREITITPLWSGWNLDAEQKYLLHKLIINYFTNLLIYCENYTTKPFMDKSFIEKPTLPNQTNSDANSDANSDTNSDANQETLQFPTIKAPFIIKTAKNINITVKKDKINIIHNYDITHGPNDKDNIVAPLPQTHNTSVAKQASVENHKSDKGIKKQPTNLINNIKKVQSTSSNHTPPKKTIYPEKKSVNGIKKIIAVCSGKGGVGKSTTTAQLAQAFKRTGLKVGIFDGDIYGPSILTLYGHDNNNTNKNYEPLIYHDIKIQSIANHIQAEKALAWRGPMVSKTIIQLLNNTNWGELDILLIDTPPGTGDAHITFGQYFDLNGVVIISTPQYIAIQDTIRTLSFYKQMNTPLLGIIQNMGSIYQYDQESHNLPMLFGKKGGKNLAQLSKLDLIADIPFFPQLVPLCDRGIADLNNVDPSLLKAKGIYFQKELLAINKIFDEAARAILTKI